MVEIERLRRRWRWTGAQIAESACVSRATGARSLGQLGLARLGPAVHRAGGTSGRGPAADAPGYQETRPHRADRTSDHRRPAGPDTGHRVGVCPRLHRRLFPGALRRSPARPAGVTVAGFLRRALTWFGRRGVVVQRILTDNGSAYRSYLLAALCRARRLGQRLTRPYSPRTNGEAERFIQTLLREWAYAVAYVSSAHRTAALERWVHYYNWHRRHSALNGQPPISSSRPGRSVESSQLAVNWGLYTAMLKTAIETQTRHYPPFSAPHPASPPPPPPPGAGRPTSVSRDSLPGQGACPEGAPAPRRHRTDFGDRGVRTRLGAEHPAGLGGSPAAPGGATFPARATRRARRGSRG